MLENTQWNICANQNANTRLRVMIKHDYYIDVCSDLLLTNYLEIIQMCFISNTLLPRSFTRAKKKKAYDTKNVKCQGSMKKRENAFWYEVNRKK